jgi:K+-sensing histidine kinase KdpD
VACQPSTIDTLCFHVEDTSMKMTDEQLGQFFLPFEPVENRQAERTNLGLAMSYRLVEMMGGQVVVKSLLDPRGMFLLKLPELNRGAIDFERCRRLKDSFGRGNYWDNRVVLVHLLKAIKQWT